MSGTQHTYDSGTDGTAAGPPMAQHPTPPPTGRLAEPPPAGVGGGARTPRTGPTTGTGAPLVGGLPGGPAQRRATVSAGDPAPAASVPRTADADVSHLDDGRGDDREVVAALGSVGVRKLTTGQVIVDDIDWSVRAGEHWALLGANGAGKTTLLRLVGAVSHPTSGTVEVLGHRLGRVDVRALRARIGLVSSAQRVPQDATGLTVVLTGASGTVQPLWRAYDDATRARAGRLLAELGCAELADRSFGVCSGGQRARLLIARALMADPLADQDQFRPQLLLLDEPFNALDLPSREDLIDTLGHLARSRPGLTTVTVTHHLEELPPSTSHALLLRAGRVQAQGPAADVLTGAGLTACFGRPIEVARHRGRWLARSAASAAADTPSGNAAPVR